MVLHARLQAGLYSWKWRKANTRPTPSHPYTFPLLSHASSPPLSNTEKKPESVVCLWGLSSAIHLFAFLLLNQARRRTEFLCSIHSSRVQEEVCGLHQRQELRLEDIPVSDLFLSLSIAIHLSIYRRGDIWRIRCVVGVFFLDVGSERDFWSTLLSSSVSSYKCSVECKCILIILGRWQEETDEMKDALFQLFSRGAFQVQAAQLCVMYMQNYLRCPRFFFFFKGNSFNNCSYESAASFSITQKMTSSNKSIRKTTTDWDTGHKPRMHMYIFFPKVENVSAISI